MITALLPFAVAKPKWKDNGSIPANPTPMKHLQRSLGHHQLKRLAQLIRRRDYIHARILHEVKGQVQLNPNVTVELRRVTKRWRGSGPSINCPHCGHRMRECEAHQLHQTVYDDEANPIRYHHCGECGYLWTDT